MPHERCGDRRRRAYADRKLRRGSEGYPGPEASGAAYVTAYMVWWTRLRDAEFIDSLWEGLPDPFCGQLMGRTAENLAEEFKIGREEQDRFAIESHRRAFRALREGRFKDETMPLSIPKSVAGREVAPAVLTQAEGPNVGLTEQQLALYPPL